MTPRAEELARATIFESEGHFESDPAVIVARAYLALLATHEGEKARYREAERVIRAARALEWSLANMVIDGKPPLWSMNVIATRDDLKRKLAAHEETERETAALAEAEALIRRADAERARALREQGLTLRQIAAELGVNAYGHPLCVDEGVMPVSSQAWKDL